MKKNKIEVEALQINENNKCTKQSKESGKIVLTLKMGTQFYERMDELLEKNIIPLSKKYPDMEIHVEIG